MNTECSGQAPYRTPTMTTDDKGKAARALATCPEWCTGTVHLEGDFDKHVGHVATVGPVSIELVQSVRDDGDPGPIGVIVAGDEYGDSPLTPDEVADLVAVLTTARASAQAAGFGSTAAGA